MASSTNVGSIHYDLKLDTGDFDRKSKQATSNVSKFGSKLKSFAKGTAIAGAAITAAGFSLKRGFIDPASDLTETINKVEVAFGNSANEIKDWAKSTIQNIGLAGSTAMDAAALFGDMGTSMGIAQNDAANMSMSLTNLAGDLASFKNLDIEQAITALNGVFTGETESLKRLGIVMTQANLELFAMEQGITTAMDEMTQAEKVNLRYQYVLSKTKNAQGDFARTSEGAANQTRMVGERLKQLREEIGNRIMPLYLALLGYVNRLIDSFDDFSAGVGRLGEKFREAGSKINNIFRPVLELLAPLFSQYINPELRKLVEIITNQLLPELKQLYELVKPVLIPVLKALALIVGVVVFGALAAFIAVVQRIYRVITGVIMIINRLIRAFKWLVQTVREAAPGILDAINRMTNGALSKILEFRRRFFNSGKELMLSFARGIGSAINVVKDKAKQVLDKVRNLLPFSDAKEGPLSDLTLSGQRFSETFADGITKGTDSIKKASESALSQSMNNDGMKNQTNNSIYGNINIANRQDADYFLSKLTRSNELLSLGAAES